LNINLNKSSGLPNVFAVVDYGIQGTDYQVKSGYVYSIGSIVLRWDIFKGFQNQAKIKQAELDKLTLDNRKSELEEQIRLEVSQAWYQLKLNFESIHSAENEYVTATEVFRIIEKKYSQGQANMLEYIDARTQLTHSGVNLITKKFDYCISEAELERAMAAYELPNSIP
jgi:outer membrane protein